MVSSLTTIDVQGTEYTGIDDVTTAPDGTLYVLTGAGDQLVPADIAVLKVDLATGSSQALPIPADAFPPSRSMSARSLAVAADGSVFTGSHLWNPHAGTTQYVTSESVSHAAFDARGELAYAVSVEDRNNNYRATTTIYRESRAGEPQVLAAVPGTANGLAFDSNAQVLLHIDATIGWGDNSKVLRISDDGDLEPLEIEDIDASSGIAVDNVGRLVYVCTDQHAMCIRTPDAPTSTRLDFTAVRPMWTSDEAVRVAGFDLTTWLPDGKALAVTPVRGKRVVVVARP
ncbi:hypothetical protein [Mycobacterium sp. DL592]|uniref:hypothetical protein n=1 Tax=Mycobacterium sp. DL592 TaxID=2675524 RepID=UPI0014205FB4|nr:hypothetical protein [Mycobacterium sp. DL592]